jgi:hypothetical protein
MKTITILSIVILLGIGAIVWNRFSLVSCEDRIKTEAKSPNGSWIATSYERDCGATTDYSSIVSIRSATAQFNSEKQIPIFVEQGQDDIELKWTSPNTLVIGSKLSKNYKKSEEFEGISIKYEKK